MIICTIFWRLAPLGFKARECIAHAEMCSISQNQRWIELAENARNKCCLSTAG